jgi:adenylate kinase family enzyme
VENKKVLILTGSGGSGKTTIANLLVKKHGFIKIDGDKLDTEFFPKGNQWLLKNSKKLSLAHDKILAETKKAHSRSRNVVIDYIIFGNYRDFFKKFKKEFKNSLEIKVLFPSEKETIARDNNRKCWTTGKRRIRKVRTELEAMKNIIGKNNFLDTTDLKQNETLDKYFIKIIKP